MVSIYQKRLTLNDLTSLYLSCAKKGASNSTALSFFLSTYSCKKEENEEKIQRNLFTKKGCRPLFTFLRSVLSDYLAGAWWREYDVKGFFFRDTFSKQFYLVGIESVTQNVCKRKNKRKSYKFNSLVHNIVRWQYDRGYFVFLYSVDVIFTVLHISCVNIAMKRMKSKSKYEFSENREKKKGQTYVRNLICLPLNDFWCSIFFFFIFSLVFALTIRHLTIF